MEQNCTSHQQRSYESTSTFFWVGTAFCVLAGFIATAGNGLVLFTTRRSKNNGPFRYLDSTIKSLAFADMLFGFIGIPMVIIGYYYGTKGYLKCHITDWRIEGLTFIPNILETTSILHVTLLVFLRLLAITDPMKYKEAHIKSRHKSIIVIWLTSIIVRLIALLSQKYHSKVFFYYRYFLLHIFHTIPIIMIVIMYGTLIMTLKKRSATLLTMTEQSQQLSDSINRKMTIVVKRIVVSLLICYVPFLSWEQYYMIIAEREPFTIYKNEVVFVAMARLLMIMNSCINPFIYAWTMPAFRNNIQKLVFERRHREVNQSNIIVDQQENRFHKRAHPTLIGIQRSSYSVTYVQ